MKLNEFIKMWTKDGTRFSERKREKLNGSIWLLYAVYFPDSTYDYGRHMAMILKMDAKTNEILKHDLSNIQGEVTPNYSQGIYEWFEAHKGKY